MSYYEQRDLVDHIANKKEYNFNIDKKCWGFNIELTDNLVAAATTSNNAIRQNIFYVRFILKPILDIKQEYIRKKKEE